MTAATEGLVDAKDQARQAESRTDLARAMLFLEQRISQTGLRIIAITIGTNIALAGLVIAVLK